MIRECLRVEFEIRNDDCPLAEATRSADTTVDASPPLLRDDGNVLLRFSAPTETGLTDVLEADSRIRYLYRSEAGERYNYRCLSVHPCVVHNLVNNGFMVESLSYRNGSAVLTGAVVGREILTEVMQTAGQTVGVRLKRVHSIGSDADTAVAKQWGITTAQEESIKRALQLGYFEIPREATADEVAAEIGISKTAFLERLRRAQRRLFDELFPHIDR